MRKIFSKTEMFRVGIKSCSSFHNKPVPVSWILFIIYLLSGGKFKSFIFPIEKVGNVKILIYLTWKEFQWKFDNLKKWRHLFQSQMSPLGSQRNFGSPGMVKRTGLQHLKPGDMSGYQKNIWSNPFQAVEESHSSSSPHHQSDLSYLQRLQAHQFPHIVPSLKSLEELESEEKMEIYENPSEHYAAIKYGESNVSKGGGVQSLEPLSAGSSSNSNSAFGNQLLQSRNCRSSQHQQTPGSVNFYGYGRSYGVTEGGGGDGGVWQRYENIKFVSCLPS